MFHRIRDLREDADLTQTELSKYLNISQRVLTHIMKMVRGTSRPMF